MLQFEDLSLRRGPRLLFEQASFRVYPGQRLGVTGANGTGKSSLFSLILGELQPDRGDLNLPRGWVIAHLAQQTPDDPRPAIEYVLDGDVELRGLEAEIAHAEAADEGTRLASLHGQLEAIDGYAALSRAGQLLHGLGFSPGDERRPVTEFSGGWRMRLNLARALMCRSDLLLLDEPTNHLDLDAVIWLENWLKAYQGTLLLIAHDREFLDSVTSHIAHLENQRITLYPGNYSAFEQLRADHLAARQSAFEKQQREIAHIRAYVDRFRAKATKARQAQSRLKAIQRMERIVPAHVDSPFRFSFHAADRTPNPLLRLDDVATGYGDTTILSGVRLTLTPGDRFGLLGRNGAGKSTLIKLLAGTLSSRGGSQDDARDLEVGYFAQHQLEQLDPEQSPLQHLQRLDRTAREQALRTFLGGFGFSNEQALMPTGPFSGGEKSRLALALIVYRRPNLLLLDEPTNHLDLTMRQALAMALQDYTGAMVLVSHDRHLLRVCCDRLLLVDDGRVTEFPGSLDDYPKWLQDTARPVSLKPAAAPAGRTATQRKEQKRREAEHRERLQPLRKKLAAAEKSLADLDARRSALDQVLAATDIYAPDKKDQLKELLTEKRGLDRLYLAQEEIWLELGQQLESAEAETIHQGKH